MTPFFEMVLGNKILLRGRKSEVPLFHTKYLPGPYTDYVFYKSGPYKVYLEGPFASQAKKKMLRTCSKVVGTHNVCKEIPVLSIKIKSVKIP